MHLDCRTGRLSLDIFLYCTEGLGVILMIPDCVCGAGGAPILGLDIRLQNVIDVVNFWIKSG